MRWIAIVLATLLLAAAPADAARTRSCGPKSAPTVAQSSTIRVYGKEQDFAACWRRSRVKPVDLYYGALGPLRLRGRYVAYVSRSCADGCGLRLEIVDVKRGESVESTDVLPGTVRTLVATRGGAAAFLVDDKGTRYIQKLDSLGPEEIDRGPEVHSLTLHRGRLHWLHGTAQRDDHIAHARRCGPIKDTHTVALSRNVRAYYTPRFTEADRYSYYACLLGGGKPFFLEYEEAYPSTATSSPVAFQVAGHHAFWLELGCYQGGCTATLHIADIAKRRQREGQLHSRGTTTYYPNRRGFAGLFDPPSPGFPDAYIYAFDSTGERLLDQGPEIDPASIAVYADAVVWRNGGEQHSAPLR